MRRRRWPWALAVLLLALVGTAIWARLFAGGPLRYFPGGALRGEVVEAPVDDWSFAAGQQYVDVESRARRLPYSRSCWFMVHEGGFYLLLPSLFGGGLHERIEEDPRVRVRIGGRVYPQNAVRFDDEEQLGALLAQLVRRLAAVEISGRVTARSADGGEMRGRMWIYRLENP